jgi:hypothetical protein
LQRGDIEAALFIGQVPFPAVWEGLHHPSLKLMSLEPADAMAVDNECADPASVLCRAPIQVLTCRVADANPTDPIAPC